MINELFDENYIATFDNFIVAAFIIPFFQCQSF